MITAYTQPTQSQFIDSYVPIPFEQLYKLGRMYKEDYESSAKQMQEFNKTYGSFDSLSNADTQAWYNETMGRIKPVVEKLGTSSDMLKSAEGRAQIAATLNNVDYGKLAALRKSAEAMDQEQKIALQMQMQGKRINPDWYTPGYLQHATVDKNGKVNVYQAQAPLEYKDTLETFNPYYSALKPTYRRDKHGNPITQNGRFIQEITDKSIAAITSPENVKAMASDPLVQKHVATDLKYGRVPKEFLNPDGSMKDYYGYVARKAAESQKAKIGVYGMETDPFALENLRFSHDLALKKKDQPVAPQQPETRSQNLFKSAAVDVLNQIKSGQKGFVKPGYNISSSFPLEDIHRLLKLRYSGNNYVSSADNAPGSTSIARSKAYSILQGSYRVDKMAPGSILLTKAGNLVGGPGVDDITDLRDLQRDLRAGKFTGVYVRPTNVSRTSSRPDKNGNFEPTHLRNTQELFIPKEQLDKYSKAARNTVGAVEANDKFVKITIDAPIFNSGSEVKTFDEQYDKDAYGTSYTKDLNQYYSNPQSYVPGPVDVPVGF